MFPSSFHLFVPSIFKDLVWENHFSFSFLNERLNSWNELLSFRVSSSFYSILKISHQFFGFTLAGFPSFYMFFLLVEMLCLTLFGNWSRHAIQYYICLRGWLAKHVGLCYQTSLNMFITLSSASTNGAWLFPFTSKARNGHTWWEGWLSLYTSVPWFGVNVREKTRWVRWCYHLCSYTWVWSFLLLLSGKVKFGNLPTFHFQKLLINLWRYSNSNILTSWASGFRLGFQFVFYVQSFLEKGPFDIAVFGES